MPFLWTFSGEPELVHSSARSDAEPMWICPYVHAHKPR